ncbi:MAG: hypothetical protein BYD32DRAFT_418617 [Podila humilis]|nr:MAG: hypothetical protein BYD32DRAFT_418617 [Podila humilis]
MALGFVIVLVVMLALLVLVALFPIVVIVVVVALVVIGVIMPLMFFSSLAVIKTSHGFPAWFVSFQEWLGVYVPGVGLEEDIRWGHLVGM